MYYCVGIGCPDPLGWYRDKPEDKRFYATCCIEAELLYVKSLDNGLVEVTDKCCKKKEHRSDSIVYSTFASNK